jgi:DNA-binding transcriptional LysR family regulator
MHPTILPQLQIFLLVARFRSFSRAARELGVSTSAVSQSVRQLEEQLRVTLLTRTTRSVCVTEAGKRLVDSADPALRQAFTALAEVSALPGETVGHIRISAPNLAVQHVFARMLPRFRKRHPRVEVELVADDRFVDIVADGYDAGVRLTEAIERDMVQVRLTNAFRFVVVGAPSYFAHHGTPERPEDLLRHECLTFRLPSTKATYAWELERGRRRWRLQVRGGIVTNNTELRISLAQQGVGLAYAFEPMVAKALRAGRLQCVLEPYAATVPGFFLYYPSRGQSSPALRLFIAAAIEQMRLHPAL